MRRAASPTACDPTGRAIARCATASILKFARVGRALRDAARTQGVIEGKVVSRAATKNAHIISPGSPKDSVMLERGTAAEVRLGAMPPLSRRRVDSEYVALLERWILSLAPASAADAGASPSTTH